MSDDISEAIRQLQIAGDWRRLDDLLRSVGVPDDGGAVAVLLAGLVDDIEHEAAAFSVVHLAEMAADEVYVAGVLAALPGLAGVSPRWARTIVARVVNNQSTFRALLVALRDATSQQQAVVGAMAAELNRWRPDRFRSRAEIIQRSLSTG